MTRAQRKAKNGPPPQPVQIDTTRMGEISASIERGIDLLAGVLNAVMFRGGERRRR